LVFLISTKQVSCNRQNAVRKISRKFNHSKTITKISHRTLFYRILPRLHSDSSCSVHLQLTVAKFISEDLRKSIIGTNGQIKRLYKPHDRKWSKLLLPPQGFGPEAKTRGGTLGVPACIHTRTKNIC